MSWSRDYIALCFSPSNWLRLGYIRQPGSKLNHVFRVMSVLIPKSSYLIDTRL